MPRVETLVAKRQHGDDLRGRIRALRHETFFDWTLTASDGQSVRANSLLLAAEIEWFESHARFSRTNGNTNEEAATITFPDLSITTLRSIVDYAYDGVISISMINVYFMIRAASYFMIKEIIDCCVWLLIENLGEGVMCEVSKLLDNYPLDELRKETTNHLIANIHDPGIIKCIHAMPVLGHLVSKYCGLDKSEVDFDKHVSEWRIWEELTRKWMRNDSKIRDFVVQHFLNRNLQWKDICCLVSKALFNASTELRKGLTKESKNEHLLREIDLSKVFPQKFDTHGSKPLFFHKEDQVFSVYPGPDEGTVLEVFNMYDDPFRIFSYKHEDGICGACSKDGVMYIVIGDPVSESDEHEKKLVAWKWTNDKKTEILLGINPQWCILDHDLFICGNLLYVVYHSRDYSVQNVLLYDISEAPDIIKPVGDINDIIGSSYAPDDSSILTQHGIYRQNGDCVEFQSFRLEEIEEMTDDDDTVQVLCWKGGFGYFYLFKKANSDCYLFVYDLRGKPVMIKKQYIPFLMSTLHADWRNCFEDTAVFKVREKEMVILNLKTLRNPYVTEGGIDLFGDEAEIPLAKEVNITNHIIVFDEISKVTVFDFLKFH